MNKTKVAKQNGRWRKKRETTLVLPSEEIGIVQNFRSKSLEGMLSKTTSTNSQDRVCIHAM